VLRHEIGGVRHAPINSTGPPTPAFVPGALDWRNCPQSPALVIDHLGDLRHRVVIPDVIPHDGVQKLIDDHLPYRNLQDAKLPVHIVTTDLVSGDSVVLSEGSAAEAIIASTAIPGRSATRIFIWPTARSPPTRRSGSRWQRGRTA
ncbi:MAG TPA: hypothetical protein VK678_12105, partial [Bradyrhizobium sp.]|nr:hypothetical protein [Bradyrhizobium sp.]